MLWVRKLLVSLFSFLTLLALLGGVVAVSLNMAFSTPNKVEPWLSQSQLYDHFLATGLTQIDQASSDGTGQATSFNSNDPIVQQAIKQAFSKQLIEQSVHNVLAGNYAWLQGKTATPEFKVDFSGAKDSFSQQIGQAVSAHLTSIPDCTMAQLSQIQTVDLLHIDCRPAGINPAAEAAQIEQQINNNSGFLSSSVITADSLSPQKSGDKSVNPYYKQFSVLPKAYQLAQKLPYAMAGLAALSALFILLAAPTKRHGWRHLTKILVTASILLSVAKLAFDIGFNKFQGQVFNTSGNGELQHSLTDFSHRAIDYVTHLELIGGLACLGLAAVIIIVLLITRMAGNRTPKVKPVADLAVPVEAEEQPMVTNIPKRKRAVMDVVGPASTPSIAATASTTKAEVPSAPVLPDGKKVTGLGRRGSIQ